VLSRFTRTLELQGEDEIQIPAAAGHKRAAPLCRWIWKRRLKLPT